MVTTLDPVLSAHTPAEPSGYAIPTTMKACPLCRSGGRSQVERHLNQIALLQCNACGFVYADLPDGLIIRVNSDYSDEAEVHYCHYQTFLDDVWFQRIAARFTKMLGAGSVLDVGCGNGRLLSHFGRLGWVCHGVDNSPWSAKFADRYGFKLFPGTIEDTASQIGEFDLVVSSSTLEHIAQPVPHVEAMAQVLRAGGSAYFCGMPNYASLTIRLGLSRFASNIPPSHVNFFTAQTLSRLFQFTGVPLRKVAVRTYGIPELHQVYRALIDTFRRQQVSTARHAGTQAPSLPRVSAAETGGVKRLFAQLLLSAFYHCGRVGRAGDKLEALVVK